MIKRLREPAVAALAVLLISGAGVAMAVDPSPTPNIPTTGTIPGVDQVEAQEVGGVAETTEVTGGVEGTEVAGAAVGWADPDVAGAAGAAANLENQQTGEN
ncbi:MAG: hypothetical protein IVW53_13350 [Chloroflexi bacterium]|nr:hypothetical protein [Chloroflexota bacterium]